ncbi:hypothetical protein [Mangrovicoccus sp. HB161399]|uniref:hypothetical protein n=1 Tax=Mangrovicoccus sp. HB161399 TaxID=2720392 RepID=UPI0020A65B9A|nr:hypothetical protein [Mangrovicoccus sp. HB161399]
MGLHHLRETVRIARDSPEAGNHPFCAMLVGPDGTVLLPRGNGLGTGGATGDAETTVARRASRLRSPEFPGAFTFCTPVEPCCMCPGACDRAGFGTVVCGMTERRLAVLAGNNPGNLALYLPGSAVFAAGRRQAGIRGLFAGTMEEAAAGHLGFWQRPPPVRQGKRPWQAVPLSGATGRRHGRGWGAGPHVRRGAPVRAGDPARRPCPAKPPERHGAARV